MKIKKNTDSQRSRFREIFIFMDILILILNRLSSNGVIFTKVNYDI